MRGVRGQLPVLQLLDHRLVQPDQHLLLVRDKWQLQYQRVHVCMLVDRARATLARATLAALHTTVISTHPLVRHRFPRRRGAASPAGPGRAAQGSSCLLDVPAAISSAVTAITTAADPAATHRLVAAASISATIPTAATIT